MGLSFLLRIVAVILLILAAIGVGHPRFNMGFAGLACWCASTLVV